MRRRRKTWGWFPKPAPKRPPPERGIKVKKIGSTWWGQRWIEALEKLSWEYSNRLARGRTYARAGRVHDLEIEQGRVTARVTGSRLSPYKVTLQVAGLGAATWKQAIAEMAKQALFSAELLAGHMPKEIDQAFRAAGASLFPAAAKDLETSCSCPDWANPCKHVAATHYVLGEAFDKDPFLLFELRGRGREQVLGELRKLRAGRGDEPAAGSQPAREAIRTVSLAGRTAAEFERRSAVAPMRFRVEPPASPGTLLRQLGTPPSWSLEEDPSRVLGALCASASLLARDIAVRWGGDPAGAEAPASGTGRPANEPRGRTRSRSLRAVAPRHGEET